MNLTDARSTILDATSASTDTYDNAQLDRSILRAATELAGRVPGVIEMTSVTKTTTANVAQVDLSSTAGFRPEYTVSCENGYNDRSTWGVSTAYALRDIVQGDGNPDSFLYKCILAHTSSSGDEPPNDAGVNWNRIYTKMGKPMRGPVNYNEIRRLFYDDGYSGEPTTFGFDDDDIMHIYPSPDAAYYLKIRYRPEFTTIDPGTTGGSTVLNIPERYIHAVLMTGAAAVVDAPTPDSLAASPQWRSFVDVDIPNIKSQISRTVSVGQKGWRRYLRTEPSTEKEGYTMVV